MPPKFQSNYLRKASIYLEIAVKDHDFPRLKELLNKNKGHILGLVNNALKDADYEMVKFLYSSFRNDVDSQPHFPTIAKLAEKFSLYINPNQGIISDPDSGVSISILEMIAEIEIAQSDNIKDISEVIKLCMYSLPAKNFSAFLSKVNIDYNALKQTLDPASAERFEGVVQSNFSYNINFASIIEVIMSKTAIIDGYKEKFVETLEYLMKCNHQNKSMIQFLALQILKGDSVNIHITEGLHGSYALTSNSIDVGVDFFQDTNFFQCDFKDAFMHELTHYFYHNIFDTGFPLPVLTDDKCSKSYLLEKRIIGVESDDQVIGGFANYLFKLENTESIDIHLRNRISSVMLETVNNKFNDKAKENFNFGEGSQKWLEQMQDFTLAIHPLVTQFAALLDNSITLPLEDYPSFASISSWMRLNLDVDAFLFGRLQSYSTKIPEEMRKHIEQKTEPGVGAFSLTCLYNTYQRTIVKNPELALQPGFDLKELMDWAMNSYIPFIVNEKKLSEAEVTFIEIMAYAIVPINREDSLEDDEGISSNFLDTNLVELPAVVQQMQCASYKIAAGDSLNLLSGYFSKHIQPLIDKSIADFCQEHMFEVTLGHEGLRSLGCVNDENICY